MSHPDDVVRTWFDEAARSGLDRLPAERVLAVRLGLSRAALRKGLAELEAEGRLLRHVGRGTFLKGTEPATAPRAAEPAPLSDAVMEAAPRDLLAARLILEPRLARLAAREATGRSIAALREAEGAVSAATGWASYDAADDGFHRALAAAAGNPILLHLFESLSVARRSMVLGRLAQRDAWTPGIAEAAAEDHARVRRAVVGRDAEAAEAALAHHIMVEGATIAAVLA